MPFRHASLNTVSQVTSDAAWTVSQNRRFRANIIVWGMPKSLSTLEIRTELADLGLVCFARGVVEWEGDHVRLVLLPKDSKGLSKDVVAKISACSRRIGCRCMLDENKRAQEAVCVDIPCVNRFAQLADECESVDDGEQSSFVSGGEGGDLSIESVSAGKAYRKLKVATWNFSGLCSEHKQREVAEAED